MCPSEQRYEARDGTVSPHSEAMGPGTPVWQEGVEDRVMIITRTAEVVEFRIGEAKRISVDTSRVSSAMMAVERGADGKLSHVLVLLMGPGMSQIRIEATREQVTVMQSRLAEVMSETEGPAVTSAQAAAVSAEHFPY